MEDMAKKLVIVESPTKTKTISKILGKDYKVMASKGHLRDLPKSQFGVDIENNFEPKYINIRGKAPIINKLKKAAKKADVVYLATDPDREGEAISWHLAYLLGLDTQDDHRVTFNEITREGVEKGMKNPKAIDQDLVDAQQARRIMDRIVGYKISPILWKKVRSGLSAGRVQSVALKLVVDREKEIEAFVPKEYWTLHGLLNKDKINFETNFVGRLNAKGKLEKIDLDSEEDCKKIEDDLAPEWTVNQVVKKNTYKRPYTPFTTSTLQQEAARRLGFSTSKTMSIAQRLYEGVNIKGEGQQGLITYMRTDSSRLSNEFIAGSLKLIKDKYGKEYAGKGKAYQKTKAGQQDAHEAIRPTQVSRTPDQVRDDLTNDQYRLYDLIWRRAVASQMKQSRSKSTRVDFNSNGYIFRVNGVEPVFDGFQKVWPVKEKVMILPEIKEDGKFKPVKIDRKQHFTQPPARYSEASLVQVLEKNGIGRPSTYSSIIRSLLNRRYTQMKKKRFVPTELGLKVNEFLMKNFPDLINERFTAKMESALDDIAEGKRGWRDLMGDFYETFEKEMEKAKKDTKSYKVKSKKTGEKCPNCGGDLVIRHGRNGDFIGCSNFPDCTYTKSIVKKIGVKCPRDGGDIVERVSKRGKVFYGCSNYPDCDYASWDKPTGEKCDLCGDLMVHRKNRKVDAVICHNEDCPNHEIK